MNQNDIARLLYEGALAVTQGRNEEARDKLLQIVELDDTNEEAWLWLSGAVDDPADQQVALENVLAINADNQAARAGLEWLAQKTGHAHIATEWSPPNKPWDDNEVVEMNCWKCSASLYSVAQFCFQCHAPVRSCLNCAFVAVARCKELQGLTNALAQQAQNRCPWWRPV
jgi:hypothetical protein